MIIPHEAKLADTLFISVTMDQLYSIAFPNYIKSYSVIKIKTLSLFSYHR
jgi:hypothetical protein